MPPWISTECSYHRLTSYVWHDTFMWVIRPIDFWALLPETRLICVTWHSHWHMSDITHSYEWHYSLIFKRSYQRCACHVWHDTWTWFTWLILMNDMTHAYEWYDTFIWVTWHIHMVDMTHSYEWHDIFIWLTWHIHMSYTTHSYEWHNTLISKHSYHRRTARRLLLEYGMGQIDFRRVFTQIYPLMLQLIIHFYKSTLT